MLQENYKTKVEFGVSAVVILVGLFFVYQASTIGTSKEMFGPSAMPFALAVSTVLGGILLASRAFRGKVGAVQDGYGFLESDLKRIAWWLGWCSLHTNLIWVFSGDNGITMLHFWRKVKSKIFFSTF